MMTDVWLLALHPNQLDPRIIRSQTMARRPKHSSVPQDKLYVGLASRSIGVVSAPVAGGNGGAGVQATNVKALGSYNWIESSDPTIAIPGEYILSTSPTSAHTIATQRTGHPTVWTNPTLPVNLRDTPGAAHFDENVARKCGFPLEPVLRAISLTQATLGAPDFKLSDERIDIVTNRNNLRKLFQLVSSRTGPKFRIDAQLAPNGRTLVLTRYEPNVGPKNTRNPTSDNYDHMFERTASVYAHPVLGGTDEDGTEVQLRPVGYHRIVRYDMLGMRFLVRSRVDSMINETMEPEVDELARVLEGTHLRTNTSHPRVSVVQVDGSKLRHVLHGKDVPQDKVMDIKTIRAVQNVYWYDLNFLSQQVHWDPLSFSRGTVYPQLFLSQTPTLKVASRSGQSITKLETHTIDTLAREHEKQSNQFRALVGVLEQMRKIMQEHGGSAQPFAFVYAGTGNMLVHKIEEQGAYLSDKGLELFWVCSGGIWIEIMNALLMQGYIRS
jgi:hypothetical protein